MTDIQASGGELSPRPTPDQIEQWWGMYTMHPAHATCSGIEYLRECPSCEAGDFLRRLGFDPYGDGVLILVGLNQDHRRLIVQLAAAEELAETKRKEDET